MGKKDTGRERKHKQGNKRQQVLSRKENKSENFDLRQLQVGKNMLHIVKNKNKNRASRITIISGTVRVHQVM